MTVLSLTPGNPGVGEGCQLGLYKAIPCGMGQVATVQPHFLLTLGGSHADLVVRLLHVLLIFIVIS